MIVKFGNLIQPHHSNNPDKPNAKDMVTEMMQKLHKAGYVRQENIIDTDGELEQVIDCIEKSMQDIIKCLGEIK